MEISRTEYWGFSVCVCGATYLQANMPLSDAGQGWPPGFANKIAVWKVSVGCNWLGLVAEIEYLTDSVKFVILDQIDQQLGLLHLVDSGGGISCV